MKSFRKKIPLFALSFLVTSLTIGAVFVGKQKTIIAQAYANGDAATYYNGISGSATGTTLLSALQALNTTKRQDLVGYDSMPNKYKLTDPGTRSGEVTSFYSGTSAKYSGNMNREHTWPASRTVGGRDNDPLEDDIHMTRPTLTSDNSSRGNSLFTYPTERGWDPGSLGDETYRGDAARIIFYCVVADSRLDLVDRDIDSSSNHTMGKLSTLLEWNLKYPVLQREKTRNEEAEKLQGNRNPFIDHPEYACRIWGDRTANTRAACDGYVTPQPIDEENIESLTLNIHEKHIEINESFSLSAIISPSSLQNKVELDWYSEDDRIATIVNGTVTGLRDGYTEIVVSTLDMQFTDRCIVTVGTGVNPGKPKSRNNGCSGNINAISIVLSVISFIGLDLLIFKKVKQK